MNELTAISTDNSCPANNLTNTLADLPLVGAYLKRIGAKPASFRRAEVKEPAGKYFRVVAKIEAKKVEDRWTVVATEGYEPTTEELPAIEAELATANWPKWQEFDGHFLTEDHIRKLPCVQAFAKQHDVADVYLLRSTEADPGLKEAVAKRDRWVGYDHTVIMAQLRLEPHDGGDKKYVPVTYWSDGEWRCMAPERDLPVYGIEQLGPDTVSSTVFLHEGAKPAKAVRALLEGGSDPENNGDHPWFEALAQGIHLGWIGGASNPHLTDWQEFMTACRRAGIMEVIIVADNDEPGVAAVRDISRQLYLPTYSVEFDTQFPPAFDLADEFPEELFAELSGQQRYIGPTLADLTEDATWVTQPAGKSFVLRKHVKSHWCFAEEPQLFICKDDPRIKRDETALQKRLAKFSHRRANPVAMLLEQAPRVQTIGYKPGRKTGVLVERNKQRIFNAYTPSPIRPAEGKPDIGRWLEFLDYLFPLQDEREHVMRWIATLIAKPERRIHYSLLLTSPPGTGKTMLALQVLAPLVGHQNTGTPTERDIAESAFNEWAVNKRLVVVGEIYQGHSWKAYNKLKTYLTDPVIEVNMKYQRPYTVDCWVHMIASSNSPNALKIDEGDRRWFCPKVTEVPWPKEKFKELVRWLNFGGGLEAIAAWARDFGSYVETGDRPPMTESKRELELESKDPGLRWIGEYCQERIVAGDSFVISSTLALRYAKKMWPRECYAKPREMVDAARKAGMIASGEEYRVSFDNETHRVLLSPEAQRELMDKVSETQKSDPNCPTKNIQQKWAKQKLGELKANLGGVEGAI